MEELLASYLDDAADGERRACRGRRGSPGRQLPREELPTALPPPPSPAPPPHPAPGPCRVRAGPQRDPVLSACLGNERGCAPAFPKFWHPLASPFCLASVRIAFGNHACLPPRRHTRLHPHTRLCPLPQVPPTTRRPVPGTRVTAPWAPRSRRPRRGRRPASALPSASGSAPGSAPARRLRSSCAHARAPGGAPLGSAPPGSSCRLQLLPRPSSWACGPVPRKRFQPAPAAGPPGSPPCRNTGQVCLLSCRFYNKRGCDSVEPAGVCVW